MSMGSSLAFSPHSCAEEDFPKQNGCFHYRSIFRELHQPMSPISPFCTASPELNITVSNVSLYLLTIFIYPWNFHPLKPLGIFYFKKSTGLNENLPLANYFCHIHLSNHLENVSRGGHNSVFKSTPEIIL